MPETEVVVKVKGVKFWRILGLGLLAVFIVLLTAYLTLWYLGATG